MIDNCCTFVISFKPSSYSYVYFLKMTGSMINTDGLIIKWQGFLSPKKDPVVKKTYFVLDSPSGPCNDFRKHSDELLKVSYHQIIVC